MAIRQPVHSYTDNGFYYSVYSVHCWFDAVAWVAGTLNEVLNHNQENCRRMSWLIVHTTEVTAIVSVKEREFFCLSACLLISAG